MLRSTKRLPALIFLGFVLSGLPVALTAEVRLPAVIGDHMVIQQEKPVVIWGWADPDEEVAVRLGGVEAETVADADGRWRLSFEPLKARGGTLEMTVRGGKGSEIVVRDILVGEVWLCSGQSNMEWSLRQLPNPAPEILRADHPGLRLFHVPRRTSDLPLDDVEAEWEVCAPDAARSFSAVAYYFGLELHRKLEVPVGLIEAAWGGTMIEPWTPPAGFAAVAGVEPLLEAQRRKYEKFRVELEETLPALEAWARKGRKALAERTPIPSPPDFPSNPYDSPQAPTTLYNGMIHALTPFAIRGAIWYQGEANRNDGLFYEKKMEALIGGWRKAWKLGDFPFYYVQLAPYNYPYNRESAGGDVPDFLRLPLIWEAQAKILRLPNTGMAVVTDIADLSNIHPANKTDVGHRLALWARARTYGETGLVFSGPLFKEMTIEGSLARLSFDHTGGGLISNDGRSLSWFEIAGDDRIFYKAIAEIAGDSVVVRSPRVPSPIAVRFGWHQLAVPNLANREGLPASPFRTDRW